MGLMLDENTPREEKPNHQVYDKCLICGGKFKAGNKIIFQTNSDPVDGASTTDPICKNCASLERERRVPKL